MNLTITKYGFDIFVIVLLEFVDSGIKKDILIAEQHCIDKKYPESLGSPLDTKRIAQALANMKRAQSNRMTQLGSYRYCIKLYFKLQLINS